MPLKNIVIFLKFYVLIDYVTIQPFSLFTVHGKISKRENASACVQG